MADTTDRLAEVLSNMNDYSLTLEESVIIHHRPHVDDAIAYIRSLAADNARLREAMVLISRAEVDVFDADLQRTVTISMCEDEMIEIARAALNPTEGAST